MGIGPKTQRIVSTVTPVTGVPGAPLIVIGDKNSTAFNGKVAVGIASTTILAANADRNIAILVNDSSRVIYVNLSGTAVLNEGIRLNKKGGSTIIGNYTGEITAINDTAGSNLTVVEIELVPAP